MERAMLLGCMEKITPNAEQSGASNVFSASLVTLIWSENSLSILAVCLLFIRKKTLSETDFLSVSILDSCIEMPQLHKLPLSQYLSV